MSSGGDSFVAEDFLRLRRGEVALWTSASVVVLCGLAGGIWAYQTYLPKTEPMGDVAGAMVVEFAKFDTSPIAEEIDVPEGEASLAAEAAPPMELEPEEIIEPIEEPPPPEAAEPAPVQEDVVEPEETPEALAEPEPIVVPEPVEPTIDVPEVDVPEPALVIPRQAAVFPPIPEPEPEPVPEPEPIDPNLAVPVAMPERIAQTRAETPPTKFEPPPPRRTAPPEQQASAQTSAPKPAAVKAEQAASPQPAPVSAPSSSQVNRWSGSVSRHIAQRRRYPADARQRGEEGRVVVQFTIDTAGRVQSVRVVGSSGFPALDQAARDLIAASSPVPAPPAGLPNAQLTIALPIDYER